MSDTGGKTDLRWSAREWDELTARAKKLELSPGQLAKQLARTALGEWHPCWMCGRQRAGACEGGPEPCEDDSYNERGGVFAAQEPRGGVAIGPAGARELVSKVPSRPLWVAVLRELQSRVGDQSDLADVARLRIAEGSVFVAGLRVQDADWLVDYDTEVVVG